MRCRRVRLKHATREVSVPGSDTSMLTDLAFCFEAGLQVSGTLNCNPNNLTGSSLPAICGGNITCKANLGLSKLLASDCDSVFPRTDDLSARQVLSASLTFTGTTCTGFVTDASKIVTRFCGP